MILFLSSAEKFISGLKNSSSGGFGSFLNESKYTHNTINRAYNHSIFVVYGGFADVHHHHNDVALH